MTKKCRVVILGSGPAGLGAAYRLARAGRADVTVVERNSVVGGNAGSFELSGFHVDYGSHRLHPACPPPVLSDIRALLGKDLQDRRRHGRIRLRNRWIHFPLQPTDLVFSLPPGFVFGTLSDAAKKLVPLGRQGQHKESFASVLEAGLGATICREFYFPYAEKIWGLEPDQLSAEQAKRRVQASSLGRLVCKVLRRLTPSRHIDGNRFFYPRKGYGQISQRYFEAARQCGARFLFNSAVESVAVASGKIESVRFQLEDRREEIGADHVWSTIPITSLVGCLHPPPLSEAIEVSRRIQFRALILIYLVVGQPRFSEFDAHYFPALDVPISRLSEPRNYSGVAEPSDRTVLCAELPCALEDHYWTMPDSELRMLVSDALASQGIPLSAPVLEVATRRLPHAYPIYQQGYEIHFRHVDDWLASIPNLISFGRQGLFVHDNTHHALAMAYAAADCLDATGNFDAAKWRSFRREFESHVVED